MTCYAVLPPNIISELKTCDVVDIYLIGTYYKSIIQQQPVENILHKGVSLNCMAIINPGTVWFEINEVPCHDPNEVTSVNNEYVNK